MNDELQGIWKTAAMAYFKVAHYPSIGLEKFNEKP
jgi:hypothetical protein